MSGFLGSITPSFSYANPTAAAALISPQAANLFFAPSRSIGTIIPGITIDEDHSDRNTITRQPVEKGAEISDHIYSENPVFSMHCRWSNADNAAILQFGEGYATEVYAKLVALKESLQLFDVSTGKRLYHNVQISELVVHTDRRSEYALDCTIHFERLTIVSTAVVALPAQDPSTQADPASTAAPADAGTKSAAPSTESQSILSKATGLTNASPSQALSTALKWTTGG